MTFLNTCKGQQPCVMIASIVSNQAICLHRFLNEIDNLDYPEVFITYALLTGNNDDNTFEILSDFESTHQGIIPGDSTKGKVWLKGFELDKTGTRFFRLATLRNLLIDQALRDEDFVLMIDSDIVHIPKNLIYELMSVMKDAEVVAPMVYIEEFREFGNAYFYDRLAFINNGINFNHFYPYIPGYSRLPDSPVFVDSVGACYLVAAKVFKAGVRYITTDEDESEQVTFCNQVRKQGFRVAVHPQVAVLHFNGEPHGIMFK